MSVGEKQTVEIVKALYRGARVLILDEPTAVLTTQETRQLFQILREMRANGCAVILITHKLQEVMEISDRVTILRKGASVASLPTGEATAENLAELMVGRAMDLSTPYLPVPRDLQQETVLAIRELATAIPLQSTYLKNLRIVSLDGTTIYDRGYDDIPYEKSEQLVETIDEASPKDSLQYI